MRIYKREIIILLVLMLSVALAKSEIVFQEDFSGYLGAYPQALNPTAQVGTWTESHIGSPLVDVRQYDLMDGSFGPCLMVVDNSLTNRTVLSANTIPYSSSPITISYNFKMRLPNVIPNELWTYAQNSNDENLTFNRYYRINDATTYQSLYQYDVGGVGTYLSMDTWYRMEMKMPAMPYTGPFNWTARVFDSSGSEVFRNDSMISYSGNAGSSVIDSFMFTAGSNSQQTSVLLDDIVIETRPLPDPLPFEDGTWTMVVLPDTQDYYAISNSASMAAANSQVDWILANKESRNIGLVLHEGDIISRNDNLSQWQAAKNIYSKLDGQVPYILSVGNHEYQNDNPSIQDTRDSTLLNTYFHASDNPLNDPAAGGIIKGFYEAGRLENTYSEFVAPDGRKMLIFSLEFGPRQGVVDWANEIAGRAEYSDYTAVLLTHGYMYNDDTRYNNDEYGTSQDGTPYAYPDIRGDTNDGEEMWKELIKGNENFELVFSGHAIGSAPRTEGNGVGNLVSENDAGDSVYQMLFNTQYFPNGGDGWLRLLEFHPDGSVQVKTYSPYLDQWRTESYDQFVIQLKDLEPELLEGDADRDGVVSAGDYASVRANFGNTGTPGIPGDANLDGIVSAEDYASIQANFGNVSSATVTPEPTTIALLSSASCVALIRRR